MSNDLMESGVHDANLLAAFLEGRLDGQERARFIAHLADCGDCRAAASAYARASAQDAHTPAFEHRRFTLTGSRVWTSLAAMVVLGTVALVVGLRLNAPAPVPPSSQPPQGAVETQPASPQPSPTDRPANPPQGVPDQPRTTGAPDTGGSLLRMRSGERKVGEKMFRLVAGEWVDRSYDPAAGLPEISAPTAAERTALLERLPVLRPYAALGDRVIVVHEGTVYKFGPPTF